ncbi:uncharacterized protein LOC121945667 [Plectropomus leopardus]|uniref:uncharacterized protein LOC121945667 n=1 Tax=Plectropomus leopardus TaxID=160734 RepID=UPI001C4D8F2C|nr:uncharacterized protein LOC121945667 [Plectropomus leopardus]
MAGISSTEHFVDEHRVELIRRVTNVTPILDALLSNDVINKESYNNIRSIPDPQDKMRALFRGPLESSGVKGKEIFYQILNKCCPHLISDLKKQCSIMDTVETMTVKKVLSETLNHLSSEEFEKFKFFLKMHKDSPTTAWSQLKVANIQDTVKLMVETYSKICVKVAKEILQKMNMTGLVQRLSDTSLRTKEKHTVDEQESPLIQRVATLASAIELLLETLSDLSDKELEEFKVSLQRQTGGCRHYSSMAYGAWRLLMIRDMQDTVFLMVLDDGRRSVETTKKLLEKMKRTDLVQRLSDSSSKPKKKRSDEHLPALIHKVATMRAVKELLLETLGYLSDEEFRWSLQFTFFKMSLPLISWRRLMRASTMTLLDLMMEMCGQHAVKVAKELLMGIKRTDMVQKLSQTSSGHKAAGSSAHPFGASTMRGEKHFDDEYWPALVQKVETMTSIIELLLETMADLSDDLLLTLTNNGFKYTLLTQTDFYKHFSDMQMFLMNMKDRKDIVFLIVLIYGEQSMETMKKVLEKMKTDLVQRLSDSSLRSKKRHLDEQQSSL